MERHSAVLVEDEAVLRHELRETLDELWPDLHVIAEAGTGSEAVQIVEQHLPDIVFLDIQLPGMNGLDVARQMQGRCHIVFLTAYDAYAVAAFEAGAIDYLLKPIEKARLAATVERLKQRLRTRANPDSLEVMLRVLSEKVEKREFLKWINASTAQGVRVITTDEVAYFQADTKYTRVVTAAGDSLVRMSLRLLEDQLDPSTFWRVHRSTIVNANAISSVVRDFRGRMFLLLKWREERLAVSAPYYWLFRQM